MVGLSPDEVGVKDLTRLSTLDEVAILEALKFRFQHDKIYTYIGNILLAVNPYKSLGIYDLSNISKYTSFDTLHEHPHIYGFAGSVYAEMRAKSIDQSVIVSGESGAGKTESAKLILSCLSQLSGSEASINKQIVAGSNLLEFFGNAKTIRNRNSSRFGKFLFLKFNSRGRMVGAHMTTYLLEKSRIVYRAEQERNYHIFYALLSGAAANVKSELSLKQGSDYQYLKLSAFEAPQTDDAANYEQAQNLLEVLGVSKADQKCIIRIIAAVLHVGNIDFALVDDQQDDAKVANEDVLKIAANLLGVLPSDLAAALTSRTATQDTRGESFTVHLNIAQACDTRDALSKALYENLFQQLLRTINSAINIDNSFKAELGDDGLYHIGVLDIFGFENFPQNSFEQLCINYANERLHQFFNHQLFQLEQQEYKTEAIDWKYIEFIDNKDCIELLSKRPVGIFYLIDESCLLQKSTDDILLQKIRSEWLSHDRFVKPTSNVQSAKFSIIHFAATVEYSINGFIMKNQDTFHADLLSVLRSSTEEFIAKMFDADIMGTTSGGGAITMGVATPAATPSGTIERESFPTPMRKASLSHDRKASLTSSTLNLKEIAKPDVPIPRPGRSDTISAQNSPKETLSPDGGNPNTGRRRTNPETPTDEPSKAVPNRGRLMSVATPPSASVKDTPKEKEKDPLPVSSSGSARKGRSNIRTVGTQFKDSLETLMTALENSEAHFVCCIKPNDQQTSDIYNDETVLKELKYLGIIETVRIRKEGFSLRMPFQQFWARYWIISPRATGYHPRIKATPKHCATILSALGFKEGQDFQAGKTKVFCRLVVTETIDQLYHAKMNKIVLLLQSRVRMVLTRKMYLRVRGKILKLQMIFRKSKANKVFRQRLKMFHEKIEKANDAKRKEEEILRSKAEAARAKQEEMERIKAGLRSIDDQEKYVNPIAQLKAAMNMRLLSHLTKIPELKLKYQFSQSPKGMDRAAFIRFLPEITRLKPIAIGSSPGLQMDEDQENVIQALFNIFDKDRDGRVHLRDIIGVLTVISLGSTDEKLEQGFKLFDVDGYGDFSRDLLQRTMHGLSTLLLNPPTIPEKHMRKGPVRTAYIQVHYDSDIVEEHTGSVYTTLQVTSKLAVDDILKLLIVKLKLGGDVSMYSLHETRTNASKIIFQRRMALREKPIEVQERWAACDCVHYMQFLLARQQSNLLTPDIRGSGSSGHRVSRSGSLRKMFSRQFTKETLQSQLPFSRSDNLGRGIVQVFYGAQTLSKTGTAGRRSVQPYIYKSLPVDADMTAEGLIEHCISKMRLTSDAKPLDQLCMYEIRFSMKDQIIGYERPLRDQDKPLLVMAMTNASDDVAKFLIADRKEVFPEPTAIQLASPDQKQVNVYLENPKSAPLTPRPRVAADFTAMKRLAVPIIWTTREMKLRFMEAVHVEGDESSFGLHEVQTQNDKKFIYERVLLDEERPLLRTRIPSGSRGSIDVLSAMPHFLLVKRHMFDTSHLMQPGFVAERSRSTSISPEAVAAVQEEETEEQQQQNFADTFAEVAFQNREGYINKEQFVETEDEQTWLLEYYTLSAIFKRNKFLPFNSY